jgi:hypothetical protein
LLCQIADDREVNGVVREALGVFGQAELFEPVRDLLHRNLSPRIYRGLTALLDEGDREYPKNGHIDMRNSQR